MTTPANIRRITLDGQDGVPAPAATLVSDYKIAFVQQVPTPALEIFPAPQQPSRGTVLISPGGGYEGLAIDMEGREVAAVFNEAGWDAAVLIYRIGKGPDTRALALEDATKALTLLQTRGGEFGLSTERIGAMGFSAGGHLTARLAHETAASGRPPAFVVLIYPTYLETEGTINDDVRPIDAPVFLCVGDKDQFMPSSAAYAAACAAAGGFCEYVVLPGGVHGLFPTAEDPEDKRKVWPKRLLPFLDALPAAAKA